MTRLEPVSRQRKRRAGPSPSHGPRDARAAGPSLSPRPRGEGWGEGPAPSLIRRLPKHLPARYHLATAVTLCLLLGATGQAQAANASDSSGFPLLSAPSDGPPREPRAADADAATYDRCLALTRTDPAAARTLAQGWINRGGAHPADHCYAVALIGLKDYKEGAGRLEKLAEAMIHAPASLRADVLGQAAQAWLLAGDPARAYAADTGALNINPKDTDLLVDRAEAAGNAGWYDKAIADLSRVLKTSPTRVDALIFRATAYRELKQFDPALADADAAVKQAPNSAAALLERGNIRGLRGDVDGARQDWQRVATLAPGSSADTAAKANIAQLDSKPDPAATPAAAPAPPARPH